MCGMDLSPPPPLPPTCSSDLNLEVLLLGPTAHSRLQGTVHYGHTGLRVCVCVCVRACECTTPTHGAQSPNWPACVRVCECVSACVCV